jgi:DNA-binding NtrC family response regulator
MLGTELAFAGVRSDCPLFPKEPKAFQSLPQNATHDPARTGALNEPMSEDSFAILIVDEEPNIRSGLQRGLATEAKTVDIAGNAEDALTKFRQTAYSIVIADIRLPSVLNGLELVEQMLRLRPHTSAIVITAHGTVETAVEAMRLGAFDFITKPIDLELIRQQVRKARERHEMWSENRELRDKLAEAGEVSRIIGNCTSMQKLLHQIRQVAATDATVMIHGESGTGKELVARAIHDLSHRSDHSFVAVNLGALPETLLESELSPQTSTPQKPIKSHPSLCWRFQRLRQLPYRWRNFPKILPAWFPKRQAG